MRFITHGEHFNLLVEEGILKARNRVWIATANVKDLHVPGAGKRSLPLLSHLERLQNRGVAIRILHGGIPSAPFMETLGKHIELLQGDCFEMQHCPRNHCKMVIVDGRLAYTGSANLTGAGMGAKSPRKRNFESGVFTDEPDMLAQMEEYFDRIWIGEYCGECGRRNVCPEPITDR